MKVLQRIFYGICALLLLGVGGLFVAPNIPFFGQIEMKIVKSGSMEPTINTGGVVVIREANTYEVGDVITFSSAGARIPTTHRISEVRVEDGQTWFITKGDANEEIDAEPVALSEVIGIVVFDVPYLGFLFDFARQPLGFGLLIGIPAFLIVVDEVEKIWREVRKLRGRRRDDDSGDAPGAVEPTRSAFTPRAVALVQAEPVAEGHERLTPRLAKVVDMRRVTVPTVVVAHEVVVRHVSMARPVTRSSWLDGATVASGMAAVFVLALALLSFTKSTLSYFNDTELSAFNTLAALAVGFEVSTNQNTFMPVDSQVGTPEGVLESTLTLEGESVPLLYDLRVEFATGTAALCDAVTVSTSDLAVPYSGGLMSLSVSAFSFPSVWSLAIDVDAGTYVPGDICEVDMVYGGWDAEDMTPLAYEDEERIRLIFTAPTGGALRSFSILLAETSTSTEVSGTSGGEPAASSTEEVAEEPPLDTPSESAVSEDGVEPAAGEESTESEGVTEEDETEAPVAEETVEIENGQVEEEKKIVTETEVEAAVVEVVAPLE